MKKILIIGICGAGKTTLAIQLAEKLNIPIIHLDRHYWKSGWVESSKEEWRKKVEELCKQDSWIMDGNFGGSFDIRFPNADAIILLDYSRSLAIFRTIKRIIKYWGKVRPDLAEGCPERFDWSFLKFVWNFHKNHRDIIEMSLEKYAVGKNVYRFKNPTQLKKFIYQLENNGRTL